MIIRIQEKEWAAFRIFFSHVGTTSILIFSRPEVAKGKIRQNFQISFCKMLSDKWYHVKVPLKGFYLNGHTVGFYLPIQKLELLF